MTASPIISVIVCTYNRANLIKGCLESLVAQTAEISQYEVIIVDNNSTDTTQKVAGGFVEQHKNFRLIKETKQGHSQARNLGWREARSELIAYIDDDAKATKCWVKQLIKAFQVVKPTPIAVGGQIFPWYDSKAPAWFADNLEIRSWGETPGFLSSPRDRFGFSGSNMAFPRHILEEHKGFSTNFGMVDGKLRMGEDTEFFVRLYELSEKRPLFWYDPAIIVYHYVPPRSMTISYRFKRAFSIGRSGFLLAENDSDTFRKLFRLKKEIAEQLLIVFRELVRAHFMWSPSAIARFENLGWAIGYLFSFITHYRQKRITYAKDD